MPAYSPGVPDDLPTEFVTVASWDLDEHDEYGCLTIQSVTDPTGDQQPADDDRAAAEDPPVAHVDIATVDGAATLTISLNQARRMRAGLDRLIARATPLPPF